MSIQPENITVAVRCRPLSRHEAYDDRLPIVEVRPNRKEIKIRHLDEQPKHFTFDYVYDQNSTQDKVYSEIAYPLVESVLEGYDATIISYGAFGTGKTFTMLGLDKEERLKGIIPRSFEQIFHHIQGTPQREFLVYMSFYEIYGEEVRDLLTYNPLNKLEVREDTEGVHLKDLSYFAVDSVEKMNHKFIQGLRHANPHQTKMGAGSNRSHHFVTITIESVEAHESGETIRRIGKLTLADLGSFYELHRTSNDPWRDFVVNKGISTFGTVISELASTKSTFISYRDSKLTWTLQNSLGGGARTAIIANIGPADYQYEYTMETLRLAKKASSIQNRPKVNSEPRKSLLKEFREEIVRVKGQLDQFYKTDVKEIFQNDKFIKVEDQEKVKEIQEKLNEEKDEIRKQADEQRRIILEKKAITEEERAKLLTELKNKEETEKLEKENVENLVKLLKKLESRVLTGSKAAAEVLQKEKEAKRAYLEEEEKRIREIKLKEIQKQKDIEGLFTENLPEEINDMKKKIFKMFTVCQEVDNEIEDQKDDFRKEKEYHLEELRTLIMEIKKKDLIINSFIPSEEVKKIEEKIILDEKSEDWVIPNKELTGNFIQREKVKVLSAMRKTGMSSTKMFTFRPNKNENVLKLDLILNDKNNGKSNGSTPQKIKEIVHKVTKHEDNSLSNPEGERDVYFRYTEDGITRDTPGKHVDKMRKFNFMTAKRPVKILRRKKENDKEIRSLDNLTTPVKESPKIKSIAEIS